MSDPHQPSCPRPDDDAFYRRLFDDSGLAMIAISPDLVICSWNAAASLVFGAQGSSMIGTPVLSVLPAEQREAAAALLRRAIDHCEINDLEFHHRDDRGAERELIMTISPVVAEGAAVVGASVCVRDITRRIQLQNERLANRKMAALGNMAGAMAHYFNNILGGIVTSVDFAMSADDPVTHARVLQQTSRALTRATQLLSGLLVFAEGDQRAEHLSDYTEIMLSLVDDIEPSLAAKNIRMDFDLPPLPVLPVPRVQLATVLRNIVQNAIDAMPDGGTLSLAGELRDGKIVTRIIDTGRGMSEEAMSRLFEPFFSTKGPLGATPGRAPGLGLAVAHGIMQVLGGSITATSPPGEGATFIITLPVPPHA